MKRSFIILKTLAIFLGFNLGFQDQSWAVIGACKGRPLPAGRDRKAYDIHLECTSNVDHYIRTMQPFDIKEWKKLESLPGVSEKDRRERMQKLRRHEIKWEGVIPYSVMEVWKWKELVYGQDISCGTETYYTTDSKGNKTSHTRIKSCWHDEVRHEERHCSDELMDYHAEFLPPPAEWKPGYLGDPKHKISRYYDILPNKFDLLPGEVEDIQIYTNKGQRSDLKPKVVIGDAWNKYEPHLMFNHNGDSSAECRYETRYKLSVKIDTITRLTNKASPNAFRIAKHRAKNPLSWLEARADLKSVPDKVYLTDSSSEIISSMARQSRKFDLERERAKESLGLGRNANEESLDALRNAEGFWQDTQVRVRLIEIRKWGRDLNPTQNIYTAGSKVATGAEYTIDLHQSGQSDAFLYAIRAGIFAPFFGNTWSPNPGKQYEIRVSMYQKGVEFYQQDCGSKPGMDCTLGLRRERHWYSKELPIGFTSESKYEARGFFQRLADWQYSSLISKWRF